MTPLRVAVGILAVVLVLAGASPILAEEDGSAIGLELRNWSAPPFVTLPKPEKEDPDSPPDIGPYSAEVTEGTAPPQVLPLQTIPPCRIADTRGNGFSGQAGPPALNTGPRVFQISGSVPGLPLQCGIPLIARAVSFQFTIVTPNSAGNLIAWPGGPAPTISVLNWSAGETALGNGTVVPLSMGGSLSVQINAATGGATGHLVLDVNGYYGPSIDDFFVHHQEMSSVSSFMITDGTIVNADINASAAIADTKLATIATAGKVADSALSSNVTKLGSTIETPEIANDAVTGAKIADIVRSVPIPLGTFFDCQTGNGAAIDFASGADRVADFGAPSTDGSRRVLSFDDDAGLEDQDSEVCSEFIVPPDYVSGGHFRFRASGGGVGATEVINCSAGQNSNPHGTVGLAPVGPLAFYTCTPTFTGLTGGTLIDFFLKITSNGTMDDPVAIFGVEFRYTASQ